MFCQVVVQYDRYCLRRRHSNSHSPWAIQVRRACRHRHHYTTTTLVANYRANVTFGGCSSGWRRRLRSWLWPRAATRVGGWTPAGNLHTEIRMGVSEIKSESFTVLFPWLRFIRLDKLGNGLSEMRRNSSQYMCTFDTSSKGQKVQKVLFILFVFQRVT